MRTRMPPTFVPLSSAVVLPAPGQEREVKALAATLAETLAKPLRKLWPSLISRIYKAT